MNPGVVIVFFPLSMGLEEDELRIQSKVQGLECSDDGGEILK